MPTFNEFFAGGAMARIGLGAGWCCSFANDFDATKGAIYRANYGADHLMVADVATMAPVTCRAPSISPGPRRHARTSASPETAPGWTAPAAAPSGRGGA